MECLFDLKNGMTSNKFPFSLKKGGKNENLFNTQRQLKLRHSTTFQVKYIHVHPQRDRISRLETILRDE